MKFITKDELCDVLLVPYNNTLTEEFREIMKNESSKDEYYDINLWFAKKLVSLKSMEIFQANYAEILDELIEKLCYFQKNKFVNINMNDLINIFITCFIFMIFDMRKVTTKEERDEHKKSVKIIEEVIKELKDKNSYVRKYLDESI